MHTDGRGALRWMVAGLVAAGLAGTIAGTGCGSGGQGFEFLGGIFPLNPPPAGGGGNGGGGGSSGGGGGLGGGLGGGSREFVDPCTLPDARKLIRISMRNDSEDFVHYFLLLVANINEGANEGAGSVCPDDIDLYTTFGYQLVADGAVRELGSVCVVGPALFYLHRGGQFRAGGASGLASAIGPAAGASSTFDAFFTSSGASVPIPDFIYFSNTGSGEGRSLLISRPILSPCSAITLAGDPICEQDGFYYVDETDRIVGTTALGFGSGRRVSAEFQGTGCQCLGSNDPFQLLGPARAAAANARCNEFLRGGRIDYVFIRDDQEPPVPQLVWRVTDANGSIVHAFDERTGVQ